MKETRNIKNKISEDTREWRRKEGDKNWREMKESGRERRRRRRKEEDAGEDICGDNREVEDCQGRRKKEEEGG